ncbi:MAG: ArsR/SmtB family transcription factor [Thermoplasmatota archaeon]
MRETDDAEDKLEILADGYAKRILVGCYRKPKPVQELSWKYDIPIAAAYRKVHELEEAGFLEVAKRETSRRGKKVKLYKTVLERAIIRFENGEFKVEFGYPAEEEKFQLEFESRF